MTSCLSATTLVLLSIQRWTPWAAELLYASSAHEAAVAPHRLKVWPGKGSVSFLVAAVACFVAFLMCLGVEER